VPPPFLNVTQANGGPVKMAELRNPLAERRLRWPGGEYETDHLSFFHLALGLSRALQRVGSRPCSASKVIEP
jgi:hypothetical protein